MTAARPVELVLFGRQPTGPQSLITMWRRERYEMQKAHLMAMAALGTDPGDDDLADEIAAYQERVDCMTDSVYGERVVRRAEIEKRTGTDEPTPRAASKALKEAYGESIRHIPQVGWLVDDLHPFTPTHRSELVGASA